MPATPRRDPVRPRRRADRARRRRARCSPGRPALGGHRRSCGGAGCARPRCAATRPARRSRDDVRRRRSSREFALPVPPARSSPRSRAGRARCIAGAAELLASLRPALRLASRCRTPTSCTGSASSATVARCRHFHHNFPSYAGRQAQARRRLLRARARRRSACAPERALFVDDNARQRRGRRARLGIHARRVAGVRGAARRRCAELGIAVDGRRMNLHRMLAAARGRGHARCASR